MNAEQKAIVSRAESQKNRCLLVTSKGEVPSDQASPVNRCGAFCALSVVLLSVTRKVRFASLNTFSGIRFVLSLDYRNML